MPTKVYVRVQERSEDPRVKWKNLGDKILIGSVDGTKFRQVQETFPPKELNITAQISEGFIGSEIFASALVALDAHDEDLHNVENMLDIRTRLDSESTETGGAYGSWKIGSNGRFLVIVETTRANKEQK